MSDFFSPFDFPHTDLRHKKKGKEETPLILIIRKKNFLFVRYPLCKYGDFIGRVRFFPIACSPPNFLCFKFVNNFFALFLDEREYATI